MVKLLMLEVTCELITGYLVIKWKNIFASESRLLLTFFLA